MNIAPISTRQIPTESAVIAYENGTLCLKSSGDSMALAQRATADLVSLTGLTRYRLGVLARSGGIELADQLRGSPVSILSCSIQDESVVAVSSRAVTSIEGTGVIDYLKNNGYSIPDYRYSDGRFSAIKLISADFLIGRDAHRSGISLEVDLAGHELPRVTYYMERLVCSNGQYLPVFEQGGRVPQYDESGIVNAATLSEYVAAWSSREFPERILSRMLVASETPASFGEAVNLMNITKLPAINGMRNHRAARRNATFADNAFDEILGDYRTRFGIASLGEIPKRDMRFLKTTTTVAGLINLATEMATYYVSREGGHEKLVNWWNRLMSGRFDLEDMEKQAIQLPARWMPMHEHVVSAN